MNKSHKPISSETLGTSVAAAEPAATTGRKARRVPVRAHAGQLALEPRIVFDAALPATLVEIQGESSSGQDALSGDLDPQEADETVPATVFGTEETETTKQMEEAAEDRADDVAATAEEISPAEASSSEVVSDESAAEGVEPERVEIIFVDSIVGDIPAYLDQHPGEIHVLDADRDGVEQMAEILAGRTGIDAIHILSHGSDGQLELGTGVLNLSSMAGEYAEELAVIRASLSAEADVLLYGCDVAQSDGGQAFVQALAQATGADVAASTDDTGALARGGDWQLEYQVGNLEAEGLAVDAWDGLLATTVPPQTLSFADVATLNGTEFTGNVTVVAGDVVRFENVLTIQGQAVDLLLTVLSVENVTNVAMVSDVARILFQSSANLDPQIEVQFSFVVAGTSDLFALPSTGRFVFVDIDSQDNIDMTEVVGMSPDFSSVVIGDDLESGGFWNTPNPVGYDFYRVDPTVAGDPTNWLDEVNVFGDPAANTVTAYTGSGFSSAQFVFGSTGSNAEVMERAINLGSFLLDSFVTNDAPVDGDESNTVTEDTTLTVADGAAGDLLANSSDGDGDTLTITQYTVAGDATVYTAGSTATISGVGALTIHGNGGYSFAPVANYAGPVPVATYTVSDGTATDTSTLTLTVTPVNDPPVLDLDGDDSSGASGGGTTLGPNLVDNGDFSAGASGFDSDYTTGGSWVLFTEGTYFIGDASVDWAPGGSDMVTADPFGSTTGQMMYINGSPTAGDVYWSQTLTVEPNTDYEFSVWATNVNNWAGPTGGGSADPQFELRIDGVVVASGQLSYLTAGVWEQFSGTWNSGSATSVTLAMSTASGATEGNDLAVTGFALNTVEVSPNPNYETTFTENGPAVLIADLDSSVTDLDDTHIESATVVLTNAQPGDVLSVGGSLPAGISVSMDTSVSGQITVTLTGSATLADYESALEALRFENTSDEPNTTDRILEVVVNDGSSNSNTATTTIHVVPVNDPPDEVSPPPVPAPSPVPGPAPAPLPETPPAPHDGTPVPVDPPHVPGVMPTPPRVHVSVAVSEASTENGLSATPLGNLMLNSPLLGEALAQASDGLLFANNTHGEDLGLVRERGFGEMETYRPALYVQHAVRHQPITTDPSLWVQHAVRASQLESQVRSAMIDANQSATPGYSTLFDPFALGAPTLAGSPLQVAETAVPEARHEAVAQATLAPQAPVEVVKTVNDPSAEKEVVQPRAAEGLRNQLQRFAKNRVSSARPITRSTVSG